MTPRSASEIAQAVGGIVAHGNADLRTGAVSIDSRSASGGDAFFAIVGPRTDGHLYLQDARTRGASVAVVSAEIAAPEGMTLIRVEDTTVALGALAADERKLRDLLVVAITGSSGKTSTKELAIRCLSARYAAEGTRGNLNNHWGLPLSILGLSDATRVAVLELGMNRPGEIATLTKICRPDVGVITNVGQAHAGFFAGIEEIADAKAELLREMPGGASAVLPASSPILLEHGRRSGRQVVTFGLDERAQIRGRQLHGDLLSGVRFECDGTPCRLQLWGRHAALNALAALAAARALGMPVAECSHAMEEVPPLVGRGVIHHLRGGLTLIDESYNSNPSSLLTILDGLVSIKHSGRRVAVIGDMLELGEKAEEAHAEVGGALAAHGIDLVLAVGEFRDTIKAAAEESGAPELHSFADSQAAAAAVAELCGDGDLVLVKGSRGVQLEQVVEALCSARTVEVAS